MILRLWLRIKCNFEVYVALEVIDNWKKKKREKQQICRFVRVNFSLVDFVITNGHNLEIARRGR